MTPIRLGMIGLVLGSLAGGCRPPPELQGAEISTPPIASPGFVLTAGAPEGSTTSAPLELVSPAFEPGGSIPVRFTCDSENVSPELAWGPPGARTVSYALIMDDPDAPAGTWVHWVVYNIPVSRAGLPEGIPAEPELSDGLRQGMNSGRGLGYAGPCPPGGTHRYFFKLFALDQMLELPPGGSVDDLRVAIDGHILWQAELMGTYRRE